MARAVLLPDEALPHWRDVVLPHTLQSWTSQIAGRNDEVKLKMDISFQVSAMANLATLGLFQDRHDHGHHVQHVLHIYPPIGTMSILSQYAWILI
jgi:hypothetical protein